MGRVKTLFPWTCTNMFAGSNLQPQVSKQARKLYSGAPLWSNNKHKKRKRLEATVVFQEPLFTMKCSSPINK